MHLDFLRHYVQVNYSSFAIINKNCKCFNCLTYTSSLEAGKLEMVSARPSSMSMMLYFLFFLVNYVHVCVDSDIVRLCFLIIHFAQCCKF